MIHIPDGCLDGPPPPEPTEAELHRACHRAGFTDPLFESIKADDRRRRDAMRPFLKSVRAHDRRRRKQRRKALGGKSRVRRRPMQVRRPRARAHRRQRRAAAGGGALDSDGGEPEPARWRVETVTSDRRGERWHATRDERNGQALLVEGKLCDRARVAPRHQPQPKTGAPEIYVSKAPNEHATRQATRTTPTPMTLCHRRSFAKLIVSHRNNRHQGGFPKVRRYAAS